MRVAKATRYFGFCSSAADYIVSESSDSDAPRLAIWLAKPDEMLNTLQIHYLNNALNVFASTSS